MKKKLYITRSIKLVAFALALILTIALLQSFLLKRIDNNTMRMEAFYLEDKGSYDAVLIGASDVYAGYSAPYAYEKFGYTSYPYATQSSPANMVLPQIKEVIKYQNPKMIIVEINAFLYKDNEIPNEASQRMFADIIPHDDIWRDYLDDTVPKDLQLEYYLPIIKYHNSWNEYPWKYKYLVAEWKLWQRGYSTFRGFKTTANQYKPKEKIYNKQLADTDEKLPLGVASQRYLMETLEYLKSNDIHNVVFMRFPHIVYKKSYTRFKRCNEAEEIIRSYGFDFVNLERYGLDHGFATDKDFYNWDHLNIYGCEKLTDYVGNMLVNDYGLTPGEQTKEQKEQWEDSVNWYHMAYNYADATIKQRVKEGKTDKGPVVSEEEKSVQMIVEYAEKHPDQGKYSVKLDQ